jgi:hypothetical protein
LCESSGSSTAPTFIANAEAHALCTTRAWHALSELTIEGRFALLASATPDGKALANVIGRLIDVKDEADYGVTIVSATKARAAMWAASRPCNAR